jgi:hypothetical protein
MSEYMFEGQEITTDLPGLRLAVRKKDIQTLEDGKLILPDSLLLVNKCGEVFAVGDFYPVDLVSSTENIEELQERASKAFVEGVAKGMEEKIVPIRPGDIGEAEWKRITSGRL